MVRSGPRYPFLIQRGSSFVGKLLSADVQLDDFGGHNSLPFFPAFPEVEIAKKVGSRRQFRPFCDDSEELIFHSSKEAVRGSQEHKFVAREDSETGPLSFV